MVAAHAFHMKTVAVGQRRFEVAKKIPFATISVVPDGAENRVYVTTDRRQYWWKPGSPPGQLKEMTGRTIVSVLGDNWLSMAAGGVYLALARQLHVQLSDEESLDLRRALGVEGTRIGSEMPRRDGVAGQPRSLTSLAEAANADVANRFADRTFASRR